MLILLVVSFTPGKTNVLKCRGCCVCLVVCISAVRPQDLCDGLLNAVLCRPVQMPFTQKLDTRASRAAVPKGKHDPSPITIGV